MNKKGGMNNKSKAAFPLPLELTNPQEARKNEQEKGVGFEELFRIKLYAKYQVYSESLRRISEVNSIIAKLIKEGKVRTQAEFWYVLAEGKKNLDKKTGLLTLGDIFKAALKHKNLSMNQYLKLDHREFNRPFLFKFTGGTSFPSGERLTRTAIKLGYDGMFDLILKTVDREIGEES